MQKIVKQYRPTWVPGDIEEKLIGWQAYRPPLSEEKTIKRRKKQIEIGQLEIDPEKAIMYS